MRVLKKVLLATLIISLLLTSTAFAAPSFTDIADSPYQEAIEILAALGVLEGYDEETYGPSETITRAELTAVITRVKGLNGLVESSDTNTGFSDVDEAHWAAQNIKVAKDMKIVSGYPDNTFKPDDPVTHAEVIKMIVATVGYGPMADNQGGYPYGYIYEASRLGIDEGVVPNANEPAPRDAVAQLLYNAMDIDMMILSSIGGQYNEVSYTPVSGMTLLSETFKAAKGEGILTGYGATKLYPSVASFREDEAVIGDRTMKVGEVDLSGLVGYNVEYLYQYDNVMNTYTLVYAKASDEQNIVTVTPDNMGRISGLGGTSTSYTYWADRNVDMQTKTIAVDPNFTLVYNNGAISRLNMSEDYFDLQSGSITWFDTDGNESYDLAIVKSYKIYTVSSVNATANVILLKKNADNRSSINLSASLTDPEFRVSYIYDGAAASIIDIKANNVISVAESVDQKSYEIVISDQEVSGSVERQSTDGLGNTIFTIDGQDFGVAAQNIDSIMLGYEGTFYVSIDGKISSMDASVDSSIYGFLMTAAINEDTMDRTGQVEILTTENEFVIMDLKEQVRLNGNMMSAQDAINDLQSVRSLITYRTDAEGKITKLNLPGGGLESDTEYLSSARFYSDHIYRPGTPLGSFKGQFYINQSSIVIFNVPGAKEDVNALEKTEFACRRFSEMGLVDNTYWDVEAYNTKDQVAPVIVIYKRGGGSSASMNSNWFVVDAVGEAVLDDGTEVLKVRGYRNMRSTTFDIEAEALKKQARSWKRGDVLYIALDTRNRLTGYRHAVTPSTLENANGNHFHLGEFAGGGTGGNTELIGGRVLEVHSTHIFCATDGDPFGSTYASSRPFKPLPTNVYLYDGERDKLTTISSSEIQVGDLVLERSVYDGVQELMIFRGIV